MDVEPDKVKANSKRGLSLYKEKYDKLYSDRYDEDDKAYSEYEQKVENEIKKKLGMSWDEAERAAAKQNDLLDSGKLKYKKSLWNKINEIEDKHYEEYSKKEKEIKERYKKQFVKDAEEYAEKLLSETGKNSLSYADVAKNAKKHYDHEHQEYWEDRIVDEFLTALGDSPLYEFDYDNLAYKKK